MFGVPAQQQEGGGLCDVPTVGVHGELPVTQQLRSAVLHQWTYSERNSDFQLG
jgi:hypothetical protein